MIHRLRLSGSAPARARARLAATLALCWTAGCVTQDRGPQPLPAEQRAGALEARADAATCTR